MVKQRKELEADRHLKRQSATKAKFDLKALREKKKKAETPVLADMQNILIEFGILAAAYHGGKLNGVNCLELMKLAKTIFERLKMCLCSVSHPNRFNDSTIEHACNLYHDICVTLDSLTLKPRMKNGEPQESDYIVAEKNLVNLHCLWT
jgi:hypothetical protein